MFKRGCLAALPFRVIVEHQDLNGDLVNFLDRLERMRPDVVLVDISTWRDPLEGLVASIRNAVGDPMIIALHISADADTILASLLAARDKELPAVLHALLKEAALRGDALRGLAAYDDQKTPAAILEVYGSLTYAEKRDALGTLASRLPYAKALLAATPPPR